jgi:radical SAM enzyme (TIGR01210 family)
VDPFRAVGTFVERERTELGTIADVATILLANRECPWRCLMCDLWTHTLEESVPHGAIPRQIRRALEELPAATRLKLYNAGSFFDPRAIPPEDLPEIAELCAPFERVVVESHPALVPSAPAFASLLTGGLEVAMGLETIHPEVLPRLQKRMSLEDFRRAAGVLAEGGIALRAFVLLGLPFVERGEAVEWAVRSIAFALECGATAVSLVPTRTGNGALDALVRRGEFEPPRLPDVEVALASGLEVAAARGRVFADLWDLERFRACDLCFDERAARLAAMNLEQRVPPPLPSACAGCGERGAGSS